MTSRAAAVAYLKQTQDRDGGWGFRAGGQAFTEATALALMNLSEASSNRDAAIRWLLRGQHRDGGWGVNHADGESGWTTAWAVWALAAGGVTDGVARGSAWLLGHRSVAVRVPPAISRLDGTLRGWSWTPQTFGWTEPTALAMLALRASATSGGSLADAGPAVEAGRAMLLDRVCAGGGWNYGNTTMITNEVPPTIPETALVLLALGGSSKAGDGPVQAALDYLERALEPPPGDLSLAWAVLGGAAWSRPVGPAAARLQAHQGPAGDWRGSPMVTALGGLAMAAVNL